MAISKIVYKSSPSATPVTWMDATTATAAAANIIAPYTAMLADGVVTTGTGSGGGGGITTETGSFTGNGAHTISFAVTGVPDIVVVYRSDLQNPTAVSDRAHAASLFYAGVIGASIYTAASSTTYSNSGSAKNAGVHDGTGIASNMVGYYDGYLYVRSGNNSNLWSTSLTYNYILYFLP